jgi:hypothetical protein
MMASIRSGIEFDLNHMEVEYSVVRYPVSPTIKHTVIAFLMSMLGIKLNNQQSKKTATTSAVYPRSIFIPIDASFDLWYETIAQGFPNDASMAFCESSDDVPGGTLGI